MSHRGGALGRLGIPLASSWATLGPSWASFRPSWANLVRFGVLLGLSGRLPDPFWVHVGVIWGPSWGHPALCWTNLRVLMQLVSNLLS